VVLLRSAPHAGPTLCALARELAAGGLRPTQACRWCCCAPLRTPGRLSVPSLASSLRAGFAQPRRVGGAAALRSARRADSLCPRSRARCGRASPNPGVSVVLLRSAPQAGPTLCALARELAAGGLRPSQACRWFCCAPLRRPG